MTQNIHTRGLLGIPVTYACRHCGCFTCLASMYNAVKDILFYHWFDGEWKDFPGMTWERNTAMYPHFGRYNSSPQTIPERKFQH